MAELLSRLRAANAQMERRDSLLGAELLERRAAQASRVGSTVRGVDGDRSDSSPLTDVGLSVDRSALAQETIVLRTGRPVLAVVGDETHLVFSDPESSVWAARLKAASAFLVSAARSVGRIEVEGHDLAWVGTGWLVRPDVVVTNRHVAAEFARSDGGSFVFRRGAGGAKMTASIDFLEEMGSTSERAFRLERILHIEDSSGPDLAFLQLSSEGTSPPAGPVALSAQADEDELVAVIGYPARDSRVPDRQLMDEIFGDVYDKKRLAPGQVTGSDSTTIRHDCSTLGGNSGSVVVSLITGEAVGLHFAGRFLSANFAVPSWIVGERLDEILSHHPRPKAQRPLPDRRIPRVERPLPAAGRDPGFSFVVPLRVTVMAGTPYLEELSPPGRTQDVPPAAADPDGEVSTEALPADYRDRHGYDETFLGPPVPLPTLTRGVDDVLTFAIDNADDATEDVLRYEHFSVQMSRSRRLCLFSAANIDGLHSLSMPRVGWRTDPRIPREAQIIKECYGAEPRFSRGHMTRREDPVWGPQDVASTANADSMHVTNAVPQMQPFNGGVWLELENYALQNARRDDMKISVFTGPFLTAEDPVRFGVQIPTEFWKVIAFIHDETGQLCATGYTMSQEDFLRDEEFVFGRHKTAQRSITSIEHRTGFSFGPLAGLDPFEETEGMDSELTDVRQIRFIGR
ncbi:DNA/RNA non-specific endonuclease [Arthrobacter sp. AET 35A]|uniref:DNA/RNA non-specific endonuclease n=1 Tax=Arthrobacter sp. AET 35A TaxID=2292643 RepID=UPI00177CDE82|nr:DNA/RNA non-specific endonuclease [Arthrobacter sp. AET 35A]